MKRTNARPPLSVTADGRGIAAHAGTRSHIQVRAPRPNHVGPGAALCGRVIRGGWAEGAHRMPRELRGQLRQRRLEPMS